MKKERTMNLFHYNDAGLVIVGDKTYPLYNISKKSKTRTVRDRQWSTTINTESIRISPVTFWKISNHYDQQFQGHDANCWLCGWYGMDYDEKCKCKKSFTVEEYLDLVPKARRNFLITLARNYLEEYTPIFKEFTDDQINEILYGTNKYGAHALMLDFPSWSTREKEIIRMKKYIKKKFK